MLAGRPNSAPPNDLFSVGAEAPNVLELLGEPKEKGAGAGAPEVWPKSDPEEGLPNENPPPPPPKVGRGSAGLTSVFTCISLVGLSSILNSCISFRGGVTGLAEGGITVGVPNENIPAAGVTGLGSAGAPNENVPELAGADGTADPKVKGAGSAAAVDVDALGGAPNAKEAGVSGADLGASFG